MDRPVSPATTVNQANGSVCRGERGGGPHKRRREDVMMNLLAGSIALVLALGYLGLIAVRVNSLPLWIVVAIGVLMMARSFYESLREGDETR
jgi:hypothetical protein